VQGFWVLANTKTQKVALIILIIFSHLAVKFLGFWVFGFLDFRSAASQIHLKIQQRRQNRVGRIETL
jgi:hypothetical protein